MLNPDKLTLQASGYPTQPLSHYQNTSMQSEFPSPTSTTDTRSWFGPVNQVANYQLRNIMAPFKPHLSACCQFSWSPELEEAFQSSKDTIVAAIRQGVEIFDMQRQPTSVLTGLSMVLATSSFNCTAAAPRAPQTAALGDG